MTRYFIRIAAALFVAQAALFAREVPITILHTCDLHGHILPTEDYEGHTNLGGVARCATVIRQVRAAENNVLLVDAGDTIQGTAVSYLSGGQVMVKVLNHLHYDAWVWGNHEFDWGLKTLVACAEKSEVPIVNANIRLAAGDGGHYTSSSPAAQIGSRLKPYLLRDVDGVKVAIVGLNTPGIPNWSRPRLIEGLEFADSVETLRKVIPAVKRDGAEVIVLVCHQGYREGGDDHANQVNAIARNFPELDAIIGGHSHRNFPEFKVSGVLYCQADHHGIHLGRVDLVYDTAAGRVTRRSSNTLLMDGQVPLDEPVMKLCRKEIKRADAALDTVVAQAKAEFDVRGAPRRETAIHDLIFESIVEALGRRRVKVDAVVHGVLDKTATLPAGPVTVRDIWEVVPYENTIGVARLTPAELREILDEDAGAYENPAFRGIWGLHWTFDPAAEPGQRVLALTRADGTALPEGKRLAVAFNSYDLASGGLRWKKLREIVDRPDSKLVEYNFQTRQAVIDYVRRHGTISPTVNGWWKMERRRVAAGP